MTRYKVRLTVDDHLTDVAGEYESNAMSRREAEDHVDKFSSFAGVEPEIVEVDGS